MQIWVQKRTWTSFPDHLFWYTNEGRAFNQLVVRSHTCQNNPINNHSSLPHVSLPGNLRCSTWPWFWEEWSGTPEGLHTKKGPQQIRAISHSTDSLRLQCPLTDQSTSLRPAQHPAYHWQGQGILPFCPEPVDENAKPHSKILQICSDQMALHYVG